MAETEAEEAAPFTGRTARARSVAAQVRDYLQTEVGGALVVLIAALVALAWANVAGDSYRSLWATRLSIRLGSFEVTEDLRHWINDGLMAFFFFVVGLEIRRELDMGELRERRRVAVPVIAALGGMVVPVLIYLAISGGRRGAHAWGIAMPTDTALCLGVLALVGPRCPQRLRVFILTLVIVDDIVALIVVAFAYSRDLSLLALAVAVVLFGLVFLLRYLRVWRGPAYFVVGLGIWVAMLRSGVHPAIAGLALGLMAGAYPPSRERLERAISLARLFREQPTPEFARSARISVDRAISSNERLQYLLHPWTSYVIVPLFALANAGVTLRADLLARAIRSPITLGVVGGLVLGKVVGISATSWLATRPRLGGLPLTVPFPQLVSASAVAGIGFTVSLFIADIALSGEQLEEATVGVLGASLIASALGWLLFRVVDVLPTGYLEWAKSLTVELPEELATPVDAEHDHIRGPSDARVTLVEYGDYECPYCGRAETAVREVVAEFREDLRYVFRHLPLTDVHQHAQMAAEAAEAAGRQDRFWEMHDLLFAHQAALEPADLGSYAEQLGLDVDRFWEEIRRGDHARHVAEDVRSADESGVTGTPTFFINGRRHRGSYDAESLRAAVRLFQSRGMPRAGPDSPRGRSEGESLA